MHRAGTPRRSTGRPNTAPLQGRAQGSEAKLHSQVGTRRIRRLPWSRHVPLRVVHEIRVARLPRRFGLRPPDVPQVTQRGPRLGHRRRTACRPQPLPCRGFELLIARPAPLLESTRNRSGDRARLDAVAVRPHRPSEPRARRQRRCHAQRDEAPGERAGQFACAFGGHGHGLAGPRAQENVQREPDREEERDRRCERNRELRHDHRSPPLRPAPWGCGRRLR